MLVRVRARARARVLAGLLAYVSAEDRVSECRRMSVCISAYVRV